MNDADWTWVAGLYEGEGSCDVLSVGTYHYARIRIRMTDLDVLQELRRIVGCGSLCGPYPPQKDHWKPIYDWTCSNSADVVRIVSMMWPRLLARRRGQIERVLQIVGERNAESIPRVRREPVRDAATGRFAAV